MTNKRNTNDETTLTPQTYFTSYQSLINMQISLDLIDGNLFINPLNGFYY